MSHETNKGRLSFLARRFNQKEADRRQGADIFAGVSPRVLEYQLLCSPGGKETDGILCASCYFKTTDSNRDSVFSIHVPLDRSKRPFALLNEGGFSYRIKDKTFWEQLELFYLRTSNGAPGVDLIVTDPESIAASDKFLTKDDVPITKFMEMMEAIKAWDHSELIKPKVFGEKHVIHHLPQVPVVSSPQRALRAVK